jgi:uncharacterized protein
MVQLKIILSALLIFLLSAARSQQPTIGNNEFNTSIKLTGRYNQVVGVEFRLFPQNKSVLNAGLKSGFIIERSVVGTDDFTEIAQIFPWTEDQWMEALSQEVEDSETYNIIELAMDFALEPSEPTAGAINFEEGIKGLKEQKSDEDFEYMIFLLTALREPVAAEGLALAFTDTDVNPGTAYTYRVGVVTPPPVYTIVPEPYTILVATEGIDYSHDVSYYEADEEISFVWEESDLLFGFDVERRNPGESEFVKINNAPIFTLSHKDSYEPQRNGFVDENLENYQLYSYRFYGHNVFGERIMFDEVQAMPRDRTPPEQPRMTRLEHVAPREVLIEWEMNIPPASDLYAFVVARSDDHDGDYQLLHPEPLSRDTRSFTDTTFIVGQMNYYIIQAVDTAFNISTSLPSAVTLVDTIPPVQPLWISGEIDSLGVVTLEVERNPERDLMGYRLFRANDPDHEFSVIFEGFVDDDSLQYQIPILFNDTVTLNSLTPRIYYKIIALDFNFNQSDFSEMMIIERPDTIPPTTPLFRRVVSRTNEIELHFALSESRDVALHELYRKTDLEAPWDIYTLLEIDQKVFKDTLVVQGTIYYYSIRARDHNGNYSEYARPVYAKAYDDGVRPPVENLSIQEQEEMLVLRWDYESVDVNTFFAVYKTNDNGRLIHYKRTQELVFSENARLGEKRQYAVKVFTSDGGESSLSVPVGLPRN